MVEAAAQKNMRLTHIFETHVPVFPPESNGTGDDHAG
jgi:hypothetical protein